MTHIAAQCITFEGRFQRQLCAWCGAVLIDHDLSQMASIDGSPPPSWAPGALVRVDGYFFSAMPDSNQLPDDSCVVLEHTR